MQDIDIKVIGIILCKKSWDFTTKDSGKRLTGCSYTAFDPENKQIYYFSITNDEAGTDLQIDDKFVANLKPNVILDLKLHSGQKGTKFKFVNCSEF